MFWYAFTITDNPENLDCYEIELEDGALIRLKTDYNFREVYENYCIIKKSENFLHAKNVLKDNIKLKKLNVLLNEIKNILDNRLRLYYYQTLEEDKSMLEASENSKEFNKLNIFNIILEEKNVRLNTYYYAITFIILFDFL